MPGLKGISEPRKLNSQATSSNWVITVAVAFFFSSTSRSSEIFVLHDLPVYFSSKGKTGFDGLVGRSLPHTVSTRLDVGTKVDSKGLRDFSRSSKSPDQGLVSDCPLPRDAYQWI